MAPDLVVRILLGFLPVLCFLGTLIYLDSDKLLYWPKKSRGVG